MMSKLNGDKSFKSSEADKDNFQEEMLFKLEQETFIPSLDRRTTKRERQNSIRESGAKSSQNPLYSES